MRENAYARQTRKFYDLIAAETAKNWYPNNILLPTIKDFLSLLPEHPRILDLGCGPGHESMRLASLGAEVVGVDSSPASIKIARQRNPNCRFYIMDFFSSGDSLGLFDGIFASGSLIHVAAEKMPGLLSVLKERLKIGGCFQALIMDGQGEKNLIYPVKGKNTRRTIYLYTKDEITRHFATAGLIYCREGYLDTGILNYGWRNYIFQKKHN
jgi:SAM-dependent methyltransferase